MIKDFNGKTYLIDSDSVCVASRDLKDTGFNVSNKKWLDSYKIKIGKGSSVKNLSNRVDPNKGQGVNFYRIDDALFARISNNSSVDVNELSLITIDRDNLLKDNPIDKELTLKIEDNSIDRVEDKQPIDEQIVTDNPIDSLVDNNEIDNAEDDNNDEEKEKIVIVSNYTTRTRFYGEIIGFIFLLIVAIFFSTNSWETLRTYFKISREDSITAFLIPAAFYGSHFACFITTCIGKVDDSAKFKLYSIVIVALSIDFIIGVLFGWDLFTASTNKYYCHKECLDIMQRTYSNFGAGFHSFISYGVPVIGFGLLAHFSLSHNWTFLNYLNKRENDRI